MGMAEEKKTYDLVVSSGEESEDSGPEDAGVLEVKNAGKKGKEAKERNYLILKLRRSAYRPSNYQPQQLPTAQLPISGACQPILMATSHHAYIKLTCDIH